MKRFSFYRQLKLACKTRPICEPIGRIRKSIHFLEIYLNFENQYYRIHAVYPERVNLTKVNEISINKI
jgi:hypothetical protein